MGNAIYVESIEPIGVACLQRTEYNNCIEKGIKMNHEIKDHTDRDLLAKILSPYTTPEQKREALIERNRRSRYG